MKTLLIAAIVGVFLFAGSAAVSWYLMNQQEIAQQDEEPTDEDISPKDLMPPVNEKVEKVDRMPVGLRTSVPLTLQSVQELSRSIKAKEKELEIREERLQQEEVGLNMLREDLGKERKELEAFSTRIESKIRKMEELVQDAKLQNEMLDKKKAEIEISSTPANDQKEIDGQLAEKLKKALTFLEPLSEETAVTFISGQAAEGNLSFASKLLESFEPRKRKKIVSLIDDDLVSQLLNVVID